MAWSDIIGQDSAKRILQAHLAAGEVPGAYILAGPEGIGKRRLAVELAKALNCANAIKGQGPCGMCPSCAQIMKGIHPDVHAVSPDGQSRQIGIEAIRYVLGRIHLRPFSAVVQLVILDGVDRLTEEAANSLLKSLEEPPKQTRFILITSQLPHCLPTITSRCQLIRCCVLDAEIVKRILLSIEACDPDVAELVVLRCGGSVSRALELIRTLARDQAIHMRLASKTVSPWVEEPLPEDRAALSHVLEEMISWLRDMAVVSTGGSMSNYVVHTKHEKTLRWQADRVDSNMCLETAFELLGLRDSIEHFANPRLVGALARERWLNLHATTVHSPQSRVHSQPQG